tara:strand:- start:480 stop:1655 length:1176 start_codon:yes stop_codon:yes gene_type:complete
MLKILILHNTYQQHGGEDAVVEAESALLRKAGHKVQVELVSNDSISGLHAKALTFFKTPYDAARKNWFANLVAAERPDVVHIHNFFPLLTPAVHEAAAEMGIPVVQTLHNYRLLCANALFLRDGTVCEKCLSGTRYSGVVHRCYRGSLSASLAVVRLQNRAFSCGSWHKHVHRFIALTAFSREKFISGGLPDGRVAVKPNFVARERPCAVQRSGALFVGRLSKEKGADTLVSAWRELPNIPLTIVGGGPEQGALEAMAPSNVTFVGQQPPERVATYMAGAQALILPSIWYEGFPMTVVEAFAAGLPVIASNIGSLGEVVTPGRSGAHFTPGNAADLARKVRELFDIPEMLERLGSGARAIYEAHYTPEANLRQLERIYDEAIAEAEQWIDL